jgi:hypothetical protein
MSINIAMFTKIFHQYSKFANQTLDWFPSDDIIRYIDNCKSQRDLLEKYDWIDKKITYKFNSHGFRCDEFTEDPSIMFLGCSNTIGIGLPLEDNWPTLVSNELNLKMINLGIGGSGSDTAFRLANHYIPQLKPKILIHLESYEGRLSLISKNEIYEFLPSNYPKEFEKFYFEWINCKENLELHELKHNFAIELICNKNNIKYIPLSLDNFIQLDSARDLSHWGILSSKVFHKKVLAKINN